MRIYIDKISSVTKNVRLSRSVETSEHISCTPGSIVVARVLNNKKIYNSLEIASGRMSILQKGDIIVVALGDRKALKGFVGETPKKLSVGDTIHLLNIGGVAGICTSASYPEVGAPLKLKVLGAVVRDGKPANIASYRLFEPTPKLKSRIPLIIVSGTCMNVGKTSTACAIIKHATLNGKRIAAAKLAGIASLKDTENMRDYGAIEVVSFVDAGFTSTIASEKIVDSIAKGAIEFLSQKKPDYIVIEFGDGVFGEYGVQAMLKDPYIAENIKRHIGCAHDPMGATKLQEVCKRLKVPLNMISGPVSDNSVGCDFIRKHLKVAAYNAIRQPEELYNNLFL